MNHFARAMPICEIYMTILEIITVSEIIQRVSCLAVVLQSQYQLFVYLDIILLGFIYSSEILKRILNCLFCDIMQVVDLVFQFLG